jgi:hypothetical protein
MEAILMNKIIKVTYVSPAIPQYPYNVEIGVVYECIKNNNEYSIRGKNFERVFSFDYIQNAFKPCEGYTWDMLDESEVTESTTKSTKQVKKTTTKVNEDK